MRTGAFAVFRQQKFNVAPVRPVPGIWRPQANQIVFSAYSGDTANLWQVALSPDKWQAIGVPVPPTSGAGPDLRPSIAAGHLAFTLVSETTNIWSIPIDANGGKILGEMKRLTEGLNQDSLPEISADGSKLVFTRAGSGSPPGVWVKALPGGKETLLAESSIYPQIASDGSRISWWDLKAAASYVGSPAGGDAQKMCETCRLMNGWSHDGKKTLYESDPTPARRLQYISVVDVASGGKTEILSNPRFAVSRGRFSPDDRWISFHAILPAARQIFLAPDRGAAVIPQDQWIPVTDGKGMDRYADWSPDGKLLYFVSERDGFRCFWAQRLDPATKHPVGEAFPVQHFHTSRRSLMGPDPIQTSMSVAADKIVFSMVEQTGNIWLKDLPQ